MIKFHPRFFILPLLALVVIGSLPAPADSGATRDQLCGPGIAAVTDPAMRLSFARAERTQSAAAAAICAHYRNSAVAPASR